MMGSLTGWAECEEPGPGRRNSARGRKGRQVPGCGEVSVVSRPRFSSDWTLVMRVPSPDVTRALLWVPSSICHRPLASDRRAVYWAELSTGFCVGALVRRAAGAVGAVFRPVAA